MKLTSRGRYAVTAMLELAHNYDCGDSISLREIASRNAIPAKYLEKQLALMRDAGLVESQRGNAGGYRLAISPDDLSVGKILASVERFDATSCGGNKNCAPDGSVCRLHGLWTLLNDRVHSFLDNISLRELAQTQVLQNGVEQIVEVRS